MPSLTKISIVTPCYNHGCFLEQTILSVINQDYPNIEYIIVDGGSTDNSVEIIRKYEKHIAYWVSEPDEGHRYALKKGFDRATGDVVAWQNADDYYEPDVFGQVMRIFSVYPQVDIVYGNVRLVDEEGKHIGELRFLPTCFFWTLFDDFTMHNQAAFFRRTLWDAMGGITFDDYFFDYDLFLRATRMARRTHFVHRILGNYRKHPDSGWFSGRYESLRKSVWVRRRRYLGRFSKVPTGVLAQLRWLCLMRRTLWYMWLGDWDYVSRGALHRLRFLSGG